jgi:N-glycosylase/DNA lyase
MVKKSSSLAELKKEYSAKKQLIEQRLREFKETWKSGNNAVFSELAFCICTPQSSALKCDAAVQFLNEKNLMQSSSTQIAAILSKKVRFHNNKAAYIALARGQLMPNTKQKLIDLGIESNPIATRNQLAENIKGLGMKEASHFLRNIGFGKELAILDRHIVRNLLRYGAISEMPKNLNKKNYLLIEEKMLAFSKRIGIPLAELDLLFWSKETGKIFK